MRIKSGLQGVNEMYDLIMGSTDAVHASPYRRALGAPPPVSSEMTFGVVRTREAAHIQSQVFYDDPMKPPEKTVQGEVIPDTKLLENEHD